MSKRIVRLTESELKNIITESVKRVLKESNGNTFKYDYSDYRDVYNTCGIPAIGAGEFQRIYDRLKNFIQTTKSTSDWEYLKLDEPIYLIKNVKHGAEYILFQTEKKRNAPQEVINLLQKLVDDVKKEETPNLWMGRSFGDVAQDVRSYLNRIYEIYDNFIASLMELHNNDELKQQDIDADWEKYNTTKNGDKKKQIDALYGEFNQKTGAFRNNLSKTALSRYDIVDNPDDEYNQKKHRFLMGDF